MIVTATIDGVTIEASGTVGECTAFVRDILKPEEYIELAPKACDPFKAHFGTCVAQDCPVVTDGKTKAQKPDTSANPVCSRCNDTKKQWSIDGVNWQPGSSSVSRFNRDCQGYGEARFPT
jgi:hypothetical protein